jgi:hypothetical protein
MTVNGRHGHRSLWRRGTTTLAGVVIAALAVVAIPAPAQAGVIGELRGFSGKCAESTPGSTANGTVVETSTCNDVATNQNWSMTSDGTFRVLGKCMDLAGGATTDGTAVVLNDCNGGISQQWRTSGTKVSSWDTLTCLTATGNGSADGAPLQISTCTGTGSQIWASPTATTPDGTPATLNSVQMSGTSVTLTWTDRSTNETGFGITKRLADGGLLRFVANVATRDSSGVGGTYTYVDTLPASGQYCYEIGTTNSGQSLATSNEMCTMPFTPRPAPTPTTGAMSILDTPVSGIESSTTVGNDGLGVIAYYDSGTDAFAGENLRVAHCLNISCSATTTTDIDTVGDVGEFPSIQLGADGFPLISYVSKRTADFSAFTEDLKVAHCADMACTSAAVTTLDSASRVYDTTSLTIADDGLGLVSYEDKAEGASKTNIKVAHCADMVCDSATLSTVDTVNSDNGAAGSLGTVSITTGAEGKGMISYFDGSPSNDLKVAYCNNADCSTSLRSTIDNGTGAGGSGGWSSITRGRDGLALISYNANYSNTGSNLRIAHCVNVYCTAVTTTVADTGGYVGWYTAIGIGGDDVGVVAYYDEVNKDLKVAHCADIACTSATNTAVDTIDDTGIQPSIAFGRDGLPLIAYMQGSRGILKSVHCGNSACTGVLVTPF